MGFDEIRNLTRGLVKGWKKGKLKEKLVETAENLLDAKIKNAELEDKNRQLEDEIRRLKGEKKKPKIKPTTTKDLNPSPKKSRSKKKKKKELEVDEEVDCDVNADELPKDAKFVGTREVIIQEMIIKRRNIKFKIKRYYSEELGKVFEGQVPEEFKGSEFGPQLTSFILYQYYKCRVPHGKIKQMLLDWGIEVSSGTICNILNNLKESFEEDMDSARNAGITKCSQVHMDDTGARFNGQKIFTFGVSNQFFTQYTTGAEKNRWAAVGALLGGKQLFILDKAAVSFVAKKLKRPHITVFLKSKVSDRIYSREELEELFEDEIFNDVYKSQRDIIRTAGALSALHSRALGPPIRFLISDEGSNFVDLIKNHQLCWVHEIRRYKLLKDVYEKLQLTVLDEVIQKWRGFYKLILEFLSNQTQELRVKVRAEFDRIVNEKTKIYAIDDMLERTEKRRKKLLLFLTYPQLAVHNNLCEQDLRERVIKRKISLQNRSLQGIKAWDLMLSLASTCRKNNLSFWRYLEDRISNREAIPPLGKFIISQP